MGVIHDTIDIQKNNFAVLSAGDILYIISSLLPCEMNFLKVYIMPGHYLTPFAFKKGAYFLSVPRICFVSHSFKKLVT